MGGNGLDAGVGVTAGNPGLACGGVEVGWGIRNVRGGMGGDEGRGEAKHEEKPKGGGVRAVEGGVGRGGGG